MRGKDLDVLQKYTNEILNVNYLTLLYNPKFKIVKGFYLLTCHFTDETLTSWLENPEYLQAPEKLENTINHVHLDDLIENEERQYEIGLVLRKIWLDKLEQKFPNQEFEVNLSPLEAGGWELGMWAKREKNKKIARTKAG